MQQPAPSSLPPLQGCSRPNLRTVAENPPVSECRERAVQAVAAILQTCDGCSQRSVWFVQSFVIMRTERFVARFVLAMRKQTRTRHEKCLFDFASYGFGFGETL